MTLATFAPKPARRSEPAPDDTGLRSLVADAVNLIQANHPRTLQRALGPSEVGEDCPRQLGYKLSGHPEVPCRQADPMPSFLGIAAHARMAEALELQNKVAGRRVWIIEQRVTIPGVLDGGAGTSDAFHIPTGTVLDWKFLGDTTFREIELNGPGRKYRTQGHVYGLGWTVLGYTVNRVAVGIFGRSKPLSSMFIKAEPFNAQLAVSELQRVAEIRAIVTWIRQRNGSIHLIPSVPGKGCFHCPFRGDPQKGFCDGA